MSPRIPSATLNNGHKIPILGFGTGARMDASVVTQVIENAIDAGYRHIDSAVKYGFEKEIGIAIKRKIKQGVVKREDLFITSKLPNTFHREDLVRIGIQKSLEELGLDYLDLFLMHWPMAFQEGDELFPKDTDGQAVPSDTPFTSTWKAMKKLVDEGLTRSIGLSNFNSLQINDILAVARIKPVVNQIECHPYLNQKKLKEFCESRGFMVVGHSPLSSPKRSTNGHPLLLNDPRLSAIAEKYEKTPAQVLIRYQIERGLAVIPNSTNKSRIISNMNVFDFTLNHEDITILDSLDTGDRICHLLGAENHKDYPFHIEF